MYCSVESKCPDNMPINMRGPSKFVTPTTLADCMLWYHFSEILLSNKTCPHLASDMDPVELITDLLDGENRRETQIIKQLLQNEDTPLSSKTEMLRVLLNRNSIQTNMLLGLNVKVHCRKSQMAEYKLLLILETLSIASCECGGNVMKTGLVQIRGLSEANYCIFRNMIFRKNGNFNMSLKDGAGVVWKISKYSFVFDPMVELCFMEEPDNGNVEYPVIPRGSIMGEEIVIE